MTDKQTEREWEGGRERVSECMNGWKELRKEREEEKDERKRERREGGKEKSEGNVKKKWVKKRERGVWRGGQKEIGREVDKEREGEERESPRERRERNDKP